MIHAIAKHQNIFMLLQSTRSNMSISTSASTLDSDWIGDDGDTYSSFLGSMYGNSVFSDDMTTSNSIMLGWDGETIVRETLIEEVCSAVVCEAIEDDGTVGTFEATYDGITEAEWDAAYEEDKELHLIAILVNNPVARKSYEDNEHIFRVSMHLELMSGKLSLEEDGRLYFLEYIEFGKSDKTAHKLLVVPESLRRQIFDLIFKDFPKIGAYKLFHHIRERYYWSRMYDNIHEWYGEFLPMQVLGIVHPFQSYNFMNKMQMVDKTETEKTDESTQIEAQAPAKEQEKNENKLSTKIEHKSTQVDQRMANTGGTKTPKEANTQGTKTPETLKKSITRGTKTPETLKKSNTRGTKTPETLKKSNTRGTKTPETLKKSNTRGTKMPEPKTSPRKNSAAPGKRNDEGEKLKEKIKRRIIFRFGKRTNKSETTMLAEKISDAVVHRLSMLSASSMGEYPEPVPSVSQLCLRSGPLKNAGSKKKIIVNAVPKDFVDQNRWDAQRLRRKRSLEKQSISSDWPPVSNKAVDEETSSMWELADEMFSSAFRCGAPQCGERNFQ